MIAPEDRGLSGHGSCDEPDPTDELTVAIHEQVANHTAALEDLTRTAEHLVHRVEALERDRDRPGSG